MSGLVDRPSRVLWGFGSGAAVLVAASVWWFQAVHVPADRQREVGLWNDRLSAMADDRRLALDEWLEDGLSNARLIARYPTVLHLLTGGAPGGSVPFPRDQGPLRHLKDLLAGVASEQRFRYAALVSADGKVLQAVGEGGETRSAAAAAIAGTAVRGGAGVVDAARYPDGIYGILFAAPALTDDEPRARGAIVLEADPETFVFPFVRVPPAATRTGETTLARREGDTALFLWASRDGARPLEIRRPLALPRFAMRLALEGAETFGEFTDYLGQPVLAATRRLRVVPWGLVVKVDLDEALALHRGRTRAQGNTGLLLELAVLALGVALLRWRSAEHEAHLNASRARTAVLLEHANDAIMFLGTDGRIQDVNPRAEELYRSERSSLIGRHVSELRAEQASVAPEGRTAEALADGVRFESVHLRSDGTRVPVEISSRAADLDGETTIVSVVRDVSERKEAEARLRRLNRLYRTLSEVNQLIVRGAGRGELFDGVCRILAEEAGFPLAWLGLKRPDGSVEIAACAGSAVAYLDGLQIRWDATPEGRGPAGTAIREGRAVVIGDLQADPPFGSWSERAASHGLVGAAAFPIPGSGGPVAALVIYGSAPEELCQQEQQLVSELAGDIAFALDSLAAAQARRSLEQKLSAIFESGLIGILFGDIHGRVFDANDAFLEMVGYSREELRQGSLRWDAITPPEHLPRDRQGVAEAREHGSCTPYEKEYLRKDGTRVWVLVGYVLLEPERERSVAFILDIGEAKRTAEALRESEARTRAIVESAVDGIVTMDERGRIDSFNPAAVRLFGYSADEVIGRSVSLLMPAALGQDHDAYVGRYIETGEARIIGIGRELVGRRKDGREFPMELSVAEFRVGGRRAFAGIVRDLSERKRLEEQFRHAQKMEAVGRLAGGVAHDFNNLLGVISGYTELARRQLAPGHAGQARLEQVAHAAERAATLTRQLLAFSRRQALEPKVLDLNLLIRDLEKLLHRLIGEDVELVVRPGEGLGAVRVDPGQIEQVLMNLAVNARDAMPKGGSLTIETDECDAEVLSRAAHWAIAPGRYVRLHVADTGEGIDPAVRERIFEPFFTTKPTGVGTGLGLATVYGIVKQSGGHVFVESEPGRGTRFSVCLPRVDDAPPPRGASSQASAARGSETVLLVEDQESLREVAAEMLSDLGYRVLAAADADAAAALAARHTGEIHLLLSDVVMPRQSGPELAARIVAVRPGIKVLFMSGYTADVLGRQGLATAGVPLLDKPFTQEGLARKVRQALDAA